MADVLSRFALPLCPSRTSFLSPVDFSRRLKLSNQSSFTSPIAAAGVGSQHGFRSSRFVAHAGVVEVDEPKWWEKKAGENMIDIHSTKEFLDALSQAGDKLVVVDFYGTWCCSCRALFPKLCKLAEEFPDVLFLKIDFDENKPMCRRLRVRVLPFFHFYRGTEGRLDSFSCSLPKFQRIRDAIETHNTPRCSIGEPLGFGDIDLSDLLMPAEALSN